MKEENTGLHLFEGKAPRRQFESLHYKQIMWISILEMMSRTAKKAFKENSHTYSWRLRRVCVGRWGTFWEPQRSRFPLHPDAEGAGDAEDCGRSVCVPGRKEGWGLQSRREGPGKGVGVWAERGCKAGTSTRLRFAIVLERNSERWKWRESSKILIWPCSFLEKESRQISNYLQIYK